MELKSEGKYVARGLSFQGVEFEQLECRLTPEQVAVYDKATELLVTVRNYLSMCSELTGWGGEGKRDAARLFWSLVQRFFKLMCMSLKLPTVLEQARKALSEARWGKSSAAPRSGRKGGNQVSPLSLCRAIRWSLGCRQQERRRPTRWICSRVPCCRTL